MLSILYAASIWIEVKHPPTKDKVCIVGEDWIRSENLKCSFVDIVLKEHPMVILPSKSSAGPEQHIYYQCSYKYKCEKL